MNSVLQTFYILGTNTDKTLWRLLKIDRMEPSELNIDEDCTMYSQSEYLDLLKVLDEEHRSTGGINFVTNCCGIIGKLSHLSMLIIPAKYSPLLCYDYASTINFLYRFH
jgi:hypothetical protein